MKKIAACLLAALMLLALCACSGSADRSEKEELIAILDEIADHASEKGAENKLQAVGSLGKLISWGKSTDMKPGEIASVVGQWLDNRTPEQQAAVKEKLSELGQAIARFGEEGGSEFLNRLGIDPSGWSDSLREIIGSVTDAVGK